MPTNNQTWLTISTKLGLPTSATHTIVGSVVGVGFAALGRHGVNWGWNGLAQILASWVITPVIAGVCAAAIFLVTKYVVLQRRNSLRAGLLMMPAYFAFTTGILTVCRTSTQLIFR
jgi:solute carrier family 20 (sodium-dependent phosphate transporter)